MIQIHDSECSHKFKKSKVHFQKNTLFGRKLPDVRKTLIISHFSNTVLAKRAAKEIFNPANIYLLKVKKGMTRKRCKIRRKITIKAPEQYHWRHFSVFIVNL